MRPRPLLIALAFVAFISLGLPDGVLGVAWPSIRDAFALPLSRLGVLLACGTCGYLLVSTTSGPLARRFGVGVLLTGSTAAVVAGLALYAASPSWWWLLPAAALGGLGAGGIDAGLNAYAAEHFSARVMSWLHACYGIGATTGPLIVTGVLAAGWSWRWSYGLLGGLMLVLAALFLATQRLWSNGHAGHAEPAERAPMLATLRRPIVWLHVLLFWVYCGIEVSAGQWLYTILTESRGVRAEVAGPVVAGYWGSLTLGRIVFGQIAARVSREAILRLAVLLVPAACGLLWLGGPSGVGGVGRVGGGAWTSFAAAWLLGFALAPVFPMLMSATPGRVRAEHTANAVGLQMSAATIGIAVLPGVAGVIGREAGLEAIPPFILALAIALLALEVAAERTARTPARAAEPDAAP